MKLNQQVLHTEELSQQQKFEIRKNKLLFNEIASLVTELSEIGVKVQSIWDLTNFNIEYQIALPLLVKHLAFDYHPHTKEGIIKALSILSARGVASAAILDVFKTTNNSKLKRAACDGLILVATRQEFEEIFALLANNSYESYWCSLFKTIDRLCGFAHIEIQKKSI